MLESLRFFSKKIQESTMIKKFLTLGMLVTLSCISQLQAQTTPCCSGAQGPAKNHIGPARPRRNTRNTRSARNTGNTRDARNTRSYWDLKDRKGQKDLKGLAAQVLSVLSTCTATWIKQLQLLEIQDLLLYLSCLIYHLRILILPWHLQRVG